MVRTADHEPLSRDASGARRGMGDRAGLRVQRAHSAAQPGNGGLVGKAGWPGPGGMVLGACAGPRANQHAGEEARHEGRERAGREGRTARVSTARHQLSPGRHS